MAAQENLYNLEVIQTDFKTITLHFKDANDAPINIAGYVLFFTAKNKVTDTDTQAVLKQTVICPSDSNSTAGIGMIAFSNIDTNIPLGNYFYDIKFQVNAGASIADRKTVATGFFRVNSTRTVRTS